MFFFVILFFQTLLAKHWVDLNAGEINAIMGPLNAKIPHLEPIRNNLKEQIQKLDSEIQKSQSPPSSDLHLQRYFLKMHLDIIQLYLNIMKSVQFIFERWLKSLKNPSMDSISRAEKIWARDLCYSLNTVSHHASYSNLEWIILEMDRLFMKGDEKGLALFRKWKDQVQKSPSFYDLNRQHHLKHVIRAPFEFNENPASSMSLLQKLSLAHYQKTLAPLAMAGLSTLAIVVLISHMKRKGEPEIPPDTYDPTSH